ncbi:hypothetical protein UFOVP1360_31 [uncultured Caudovirales phage]|uniref:Uncharacterized protein n=1 Tax=uncultured Caudovirales phage TaxID=2100421 RepID=A0A6J5RUF7_9CAUD|nr:hypothetical protein UFOVP1360_31 [uncultured Caudovirales phage]
MDATRFPAETLARLVGADPESETFASDFARKLGLKVNSVDVALRRYGRTLSAEQADEWATAAGLGPEVVWPDEWSAFEGVGAGVCRCQFGPFVDPEDDGVCDRCGKDRGTRTPSKATQAHRQWEAMRVRDGLTYAELAARVGVHPETARKRCAAVRPLRQYGVNTERVKTMHAEGSTVAEICEATGLHKTAVYKVLKLGGTKVPELTAAEHLLVRRLRDEDGLTFRAIADRLARNLATVRRSYYGVVRST